MYKIGETILLRGRVVRKTEAEGTKPMYRVNMSIRDAVPLEIHEEDIAGTMMNIVKLEEGKEE